MCDRIVNPLRTDNHDNKTCIPRQLFVLKLTCIKNYFQSDQGQLQNQLQGRVLCCIIIT